MPAPLPPPCLLSPRDASAGLDADKVFDELLALRIAQSRVEAKLEELSVSQHHIGEGVAELKELLGSAPSATPSRNHALQETSPRTRSGGHSIFARSERDWGDTHSSYGIVSRRMGSDGMPMMHSSEEPEDTPKSDRNKEFVASTLPLGWPGVLRTRMEVHPSFEPMVGRGSVGMSMDKPMWSFSKRMNASNVADALSKQQEESRWRALVIDPNCRFHMLYSIMSLFILIYDLTLLPYVLAWDVDFTGFLYVSSWITPIFWTCDIGVNFFTGFYSGGELIKDLTKIRKAYLRSWFGPDACVVGCDWLSLVLSETSSFSSSSRSLKMLRFTKLGRLVRIVGMVRMLRAVRILEELAELYLTEGSRLGFRMFNLFAGILWVAHILACIWYAVGKAAPSDTGARWVDMASLTVDGNKLNYLDTDALYQYMVAFHWASGQIALGGIDVNPVNSWERVVYIFAMMCGFLFGSTLVSTLSAAMMDYQMMQKETTEKLRTLRKYLRENNVEAQVAVPVQKQVEQRLNAREMLEEDAVETLRLLSTDLRSQLRFEIQRKCLTRHPLFRLWSSIDLRWMQRTCMRAVRPVHLRPKDELFSPGSMAAVAYAVDTGELIYSQGPDSSPVTNNTRVRVGHGKWLCEAALWVEWTRVGKAEAETSCTLLEIAAEPLFSCFHMELTIHDIAVEYCAQFHKRVLSAHPPRAPWPSDLEVPFTDYCDLVVSMSPQTQVIIGREALSLMNAKKIEKLAQEVESSKSIVVALQAGSIIRVASLVVLEVEDSMGRRFVQVGKWDGKRIKGTCQLPGLKMQRDELVSDTADRLFDTRLMPLRGKLVFEGFRRENKESMSKEFGVQTRYIRSICMAKFGEDEIFDAPRCTHRAGAEPELSHIYSDRRSEDDDAASIGGKMDHVQSRLLMAVQNAEVFVIHKEGKEATLYAWLAQETVNALTSPGGDKVLACWMSRLGMPSECMEEATCDDIDLESTRRLPS